MEMLKNQNEMRLKDKEDEKKEKEAVKEENKAAREEMAKQMRDGIKEEIKEVIKPWQEKTNAVEKKTEDLAEVVSTLTKEVAGLKQQLANTHTWAEVAREGERPKEGAGAQATLTGANTAPLGRKMIQKEHDKDINEEVKKEEILYKARKTLGFGPIKAEDIARQYKECSIFGKATNETEAREMAVMELMILDMKISKEELKEMDIIRVFAPKRENAQMLYCEFKKMSSVYQVYSHSRHMRRGTTISPYIPKEHYSRYRAMEEICYNMRKEEGARTKVKMGERGLEVWKKEPGDLDYNKVPIDSLGELPEVGMPKKEESREDRHLTRSPPAGRPGYIPPSARWQQGKRDRSKSNTASPASRSPPNKKADEGAGRKEGQNDEKAEDDLSLVQDPTISPIIKGLLKRPDLGKVTSIQASTPSKKTEDNTINSPIFRKANNATN